MKTECTCIPRTDDPGAWHEVGCPLYKASERKERNIVIRYVEFSNLAFELWNTDKTRQIAAFATRDDMETYLDGRKSK